jgi:SAM-dependent methyltransferase
LATGTGPPVRDVLDLGAGTGKLTSRLVERGLKVVAVDPITEMLDVLRESLPDTPALLGSAEQIPLDDDTVDAVLVAQAWHWFDPERAVAEVVRVLRPGGIVVINVPAYMWMWSYHDDSCQTKRRYTRPELAGLLRGAGFEDVRTTHWNALPFPLLWAKRKIFRTAQDTSDVKPYPAVLEAGFNAAMAVEHAWVRAGGRWAWGSSVFATARKPQ